MAKIEKIEILGECEAKKPFKILQSQEGIGKTFLSPDVAVCQECLKELFDPTNRRYLYPLINCTNCGPRYTIITSLPYDRKNTTMAPFKMCRECEKEYNDPSSRFYHAQPIGCLKCGPKVRFDKFEGIEAVQEIRKKIEEGEVVAIKGIGGFHLVAKIEGARKLREIKKRSLKPFALMFPSISTIKNYCNLTPQEEKLLLSKERPIVVVKAKRELKEVAPNLDRLGVFLPYTPIYYLLLQNDPLIVTSANISNTPIALQKKEVEKFTPYILDYEREIARGCDDSVVTQVQGKKLFYRFSRGYAPKSFFIPKNLPSILAIGARKKNSIALAFENSLILSPYIGDISTIESFEYFKKVVEDLKKIYSFKPQIVVFDKHPHYETSLFAKKLTGVKKIPLQHHLAHAYALKAELELIEKKNKELAIFTWDGTGYGDDGKIWGGEVFVEDRRKYHFEYIKIVGGEKAIKRIELIAKSFLKHSNLEVNDPLFEIAYKKGIAFYTSSVGRMFDAIAYFSNLTKIGEYEGYTGMLVEKAYDSSEKGRFEWKIEEGVIKLDWETIIKERKNLPSKFLNTLASIVVEIASRENLGIGLTGGVFQNKTLLELILKEAKGRFCFFPTQTPVNDGGIALGQAWYAIKSLE